METSRGKAALRNDTVSPQKTSVGVGWARPRHRRADSPQGCGLASPARARVCSGPICDVTVCRRHRLEWGALGCDAVRSGVSARSAHAGRGRESADGVAGGGVTSCRPLPGQPVTVPAVGAQRPGRRRTRGVRSVECGRRGLGGPREA